MFLKKKKKSRKYCGHGQRKADLLFFLASQKTELNEKTQK